MSEGFSDPITAGNVLVLPAIQSPNFNLANPPASPTPSWAILQNGLAYFFGLILAGGTITGPDYDINSLGFFFYSGTPGVGNPPIAWITSSAVDRFGNAVPLGIVGSTSAASGDVAALNGGLLEFSGTGVFGLASIGLSNPGTLQFTGSLESGLDVHGLFALLSKTANSGTGPAFQVGANTALISMAGTQANPSLITTDTWTNITPAANWAAGARTPQARLYPDNTVRLRGQMKATAATLSGATMFTLGFTFAEATFFMTSNTLTGWTAGGSTVAMNAGGTVTAQASGALNNTVNLDGCYASID